MLLCRPSCEHTPGEKITLLVYPFFFFIRYLVIIHVSLAKLHRSANKLMGEEYSNKRRDVEALVGSL